MGLTSTDASDAAGGRGVLDGSLRPLTPGRPAAGPVSTCRVVAGDNLFVRRALERGPLDGPVLVIAGADGSRAACLGGTVGAQLVARGFTAVVTDGLVRDSAELRVLPLAIWCRGVTPLRPAQKGPGSVAEPVEVGGIEVRPGDFLVADDDGIVVWPGERAAELRALAEA